MIRVMIGNLFESQVQTLVNTVNTVGVMGKGIALEFKRRFPDMYEDYLRRCQRHEVRLGRPYLYKRLLPPWILNFPTKEHWRSVARLDSIVQGLEYLLQHYREWGIISLAVPPLGCGQGQLEWRIVGPTLYRYLSRMDIPVELYAPYGTPHEEMGVHFLEQRSELEQQLTMPEPEWVQPAWVGLVEILRRLEEQPYHWPVGRTRFQKIAYVATEEGLPTGLHFRQGSYGPFAPELKGVMTRLVNNGLIREERLGRMLAVWVGPTFADARKAYAEHLGQWEGIIEKVVDLFMRVDTDQAEMMTTVLYAAKGLARAAKERPSEKDVLGAVMQWKQRRKPALDEQAVAVTVRDLASLGWLAVRASEDLPLPEEMLG
ncbi:MAG: type II toxin-antitoxin system antitoxin DNA ADP-ribosyl glycohydrolase DarG [Anaerolineae bacterium]